MMLFVRMSVLNRSGTSELSEAAVEGGSEVWGGVLASTLTTVAVFLPISFVEGVAGELFGDLSIAVVSSLMASLAVALFAVPMLGSLWLLSLCLIIFIAANLAVGFTFSTLARSQLQAMQMGVFFFLPSMLLSGFLFPFRGMPDWAQALGQAIPLTHYLRVVRGVMLKGSGLADVAHNIWPLFLFWAVVAGIALLRR